ncbi:hypothetical protein [Actinomadura miaoliensis]|uniref:Uncharacterized protein n=1 Tax=Actinomadura miaoliensis TaxID=430685 RepID=A0ABP7VH17_9ACTN
MPDEQFRPLARRSGQTDLRSRPRAVPEKVLTIRIDDNETYDDADLKVKDSPGDLAEPPDGSAGTRPGEAAAVRDDAALDVVGDAADHEHRRQP